MMVPRTLRSPTINDDVRGIRVVGLLGKTSRNTLTGQTYSCPAIRNNNDRVAGASGGAKSSPPGAMAPGMPDAPAADGCVSRVCCVSGAVANDPSEAVVDVGQSGDGTGSELGTAVEAKGR